MYNALYKELQKLVFVELFNILAFQNLHFALSYFYLLFLLNILG